MARKKTTKCDFCGERIFGQRGCVGKKRRAACPNYQKFKEETGSKAKSRDRAEAGTQQPNA